MKKMNMKSFGAMLALFLAFVLIGSIAVRADGPTVIDLGTAGDFVILTKTGITNVPSSNITGNIGTSLDEANTNTSFAGITCGEITGLIYSFNSTGPLPCVLIDATLIGTAVGDMEAAYTQASAPATPAGVGATNLNVNAGTLNGQNFVPGTYTWDTPGDVTIMGDITITGSATDVWVFQVNGTLDLAADKNIILGGDAQASNIFWQVSGAVTLGANSHFEGNILAQTSIALLNGASINGRLLAQSAVALDQNTIDLSIIIPDTTAPVLTLLGSTSIDLTVGDSYTDAGATANDDIDGDITLNIVIGGDVVDTATVGTYVITYNVQDAAGNPAIEVTRTVNVSAVPVPTPTPPAVSHGGGGITYCSATVTTFCRPLSGQIITFPSGVGQVLGAATINTPVLDAQIASIKSQLVTLIQQLINKLQAQTVAMQSVPGFPITGFSQQ